jgi:hypothetical protein
MSRAEWLFQTLRKALKEKDADHNSWKSAQVHRKEGQNGHWQRPCKYLQMSLYGVWDLFQSNTKGKEVSGSIGQTR